MPLAPDRHINPPASVPTDEEDAEMETDLIQYEVKPTDSGNHPSAVRDGFTHRVVQWTGLVNRADGVDWTPKTLGFYKSKAAANRAMAQFKRA